MNSLSADHRRHLFPRGPGLALRALAFGALCVGLMVTDMRSEELKPARERMARALAPVVWMAGLPYRIADLAAHFELRESLQRENAALREKQLVQEARLQKLDALEAENRRIRELLASASELEEKVLIAEIIQANQDPYRHQIVLNKGSNQGVYKGQALIDAHGVLGQVVQVNPSNAVALLITDPDHGIPVEINRTGLQTIALGRGDGQGLRLPFLPGNADIQVGDLLVSSALGGRFPAGYPVGQIYELKHTPGEHFKEAIAFPAARLNQGRQALLVWTQNLQQSEAEAAAAELVDTPAAAVAPTKPAPAAAKPASKPAEAQPQGTPPREAPRP